jgi:2',3'-cyclic-nucleotide 2'-phosphodiesterase (5'-nucleotidase family)
MLRGIFMIAVFASFLIFMSLVFSGADVHAGDDVLSAIAQHGATTATAPAAAQASLAPALALAPSPSPSAAPATHIVQIIHVNDMHSFWEGSEYQGFGGYSRVKSLMDELQEKGRQKGWTTIRLDAGDFSDGNVDFLSEEGKPSFVLEKMMNFDVIALGNHDYLRGMEELSARNLDPQQRLPLVAANVIYPRETGIEPGRMIERDGLKIAVAGASVKSMLWNWAAWPARFIDPIKPVDTWLGQHPADLRIALTHLGYEYDEILGHKTQNVDIIVGGHSHTPLFEPLTVKNKKHRIVPIVQAGAHGMYVGEFVLKLTQGKPPQVLSYQLHPVIEGMKESSEVENYVNEKRQALGEELGVDLDHVVAHARESFFPQLESAPLFGNFIADGLKEATGATIAVDSPFIYGERIAAGPVTIGEIFNYAPHLYYWSSKGWSVYTCDVHPVNLAVMITYLSMKGIPLAVSGMHVRLDSQDLVLSMIGDDGHALDWTKKYKMAFSEGFGQALTTEPFLENFLCSDEKATDVLVRNALLMKAAKMKIISISALGEPRIVGGSRKVIRQ